MRHRLPVRALALATAAVLVAACTQHPSADDGHATGATDTHAAVHVDDLDTEAHDDAHADLRFDYPVPRDHVPWTPDAPLVEGMARVRAALAGLDGEDGHDPAAVQAATDEVDDAIDFMFANCALDPEPDVALHAVLARLMAGTRDLRADPGNLRPLADMQAAVVNYEQLFADPAAPRDAGA